MLTYTVQNEEQLKTIARQMVPYLSANTTILLHGELGAGKTTFTKGIAQGLGITQNIKSPTYNLIKEYESGDLPLFHMDVYRLEDIGGEGIGFEEYFERDGISVVEWSQFIAEFLPEEHIDITLVKDDNADEVRHIQITATNEYLFLLEKFASFMN